MSSIDPLTIIRKYYAPESKAYHLLVYHSRMVTEKALMIAQKAEDLHPDLNFIKEASMLHDIGIFLTNEPRIGCYGNKAYICHGYLGRNPGERGLASTCPCLLKTRRSWFSHKRYQRTKPASSQKAHDAHFC